MRFFDIINKIIDYIFPPRCLSCSEFTIKHNGFCGFCWGKMNFISKPYCKLCGFKFNISDIEDLICGKCYLKKPKFDLARSLLKFDENSKKAIHLLKYYDKTELASLFAKLICARYEEEFSQSDFIVPVPMHKLKRLFRMYNQSQILGQEIAKIMNKPLISDLLIKSKWTKSQTSLSQKERRKNLSDSFRINPKYCIKDKKILLIDDVLTTGTTISKCSEILKKHGAELVLVSTIATT